MQYLPVSLARQSELELKPLRRSHQHIREVARPKLLAARLKERPHRRLLESYNLVSRPRVRHIAAPVLKVIVLRQHQVRDRSRVIHHIRETHDEWHIIGGSLEAHRIRQTVNRVRSTHHQHLYLAPRHLVRKSVPLRERRAALRRWNPVNSRAGIEHNPALVLHAAHQVVQRVDCRHVEHAVRVRRRRTAAKRDRRLMRSEIMRNLPDLIRAHTRPFRHRLRSVRVDVECRCQCVRRPRIPKPVSNDHLRDAQRKHALHARLHIHPGIRIRRAHREARVHMYECSSVMLVIAELAIAAPVSHRRNPCIKEVRPKRKHRARVANVKVRHHVLAEHLLNCGLDSSLL